MQTTNEVFWSLLAIVESEKLRQEPIKRASPNLWSSTLSRLKVEKSPAAFERCDLALSFSMACFRISKTVKTAQSCHEAVPSDGVLKKHNKRFTDSPGIHLLPPFSHTFTNCVSLGAPAKDGGLEGRKSYPTPRSVYLEPEGSGRGNRRVSRLCHHQTRNEVTQWSLAKLPFRWILLQTS